VKCSSDKLFTPLYLKLADTMNWPDEEPVFYLLSKDGLFRCRNHRFFRSCVPAPDWPSELAGQKPFLRLGYPPIPQAMFEKIVGFFSVIGNLHSSEAAVLIGYDLDGKRVVPIVPDQVATVGTSWNGGAYPVDVVYETPVLPPRTILIGDIHSHVDGPAYSSHTDQMDEAHRPGFHLVVGRIQEEPPEFHCEATVDGVRFPIHDLNQVIEGYAHRRCEEVPREWVKKVKVKPWVSFSQSGSASGYYAT